MIKTKEDFKKELIKRFPQNNIEILEYTGANQPIKYKCLDCGKEYYKNRANHLYENKTLCQKCYTSRESEIRNKFIYKINKDSNFILVGAIGATNIPVEIQCNKCKRNSKVYMYNYIKNEHSCKYCGKNGSKVDIIEFQQRMKINNKEDYEIINFKNYTSSATFKHKKCKFVFTQLPDNFLKGRGCPHCYKKISKGEQKIINYLEQNNYSYEFQKKFEELGKKSYDFYLPKERILIEYQGEQHYTPLKCFGGEEKFKKQIESDEKKKQFAKDNHYFLIEIPYYEYNNIEIILSKLKGSTTISKESTLK